MKNNIIILLFSFVCVFTSCTDDIVIDLPENDPKLVVQAWFKKGANEQIVFLGETTKFDAKGPANIPLNGAKVVINCSDGNTYNMSPLDSGKYSITSADFVIEIDKKYSLTIVTPVGQQYSTSEQTCRYVPKIDGHLVLSGEILGELSDFMKGRKGFFTTLTYREAIGKGDSYAWKMYRNGEDLSTGNNFIYRNDDFLVDGGVVPYSLAIFPDSLGIGDTIRVEQMSLNSDVFDFFTRLQSQDNGGGPFSTAPAPVEGNIFNVVDKNELVLGAFIVSDMDYFEMILTDDNVYKTPSFELFQILTAEGQ